jgi:hypothetical protein
MKNIAVDQIRNWRISALERIDAAKARMQNLENVFVRDMNAQRALIGAEQATVEGIDKILERIDG